MYVVFDRGDRAVCESLQAQARAYDCPFAIVEKPPAEEVSAEAERAELERACCVLVLCSEGTGRAAQLADTLALAKQLGKPTFLLRATWSAAACRPCGAAPDEPIWAFRWCNVLALLEGSAPADDQRVDARVAEPRDRRQAG